MRHVAILVVGLLATMMLISCDSPSFAEGESTAIVKYEIRTGEMKSPSFCLIGYDDHDFFEGYQGNGIWLVEARSRAWSDKHSRTALEGLGRVAVLFTPERAIWEVYEHTEIVLALMVDGSSNPHTFC